MIMIRFQTRAVGGILGESSSALYVFATHLLSACGMVFETNSMRISTLYTEGLLF